jgi:hypothetical protein
MEAPSARQSAQPGSEIPLTIGPPKRRPSKLLALALSLAALLALPSAASAQAHKASCASATTARPTGGVQACASSVRGRKTHSRGRHARHRAGHRAARKHSTPASSPAPASTADTNAPFCDDGSEATRQGSGALACADGTKPTCEYGASVTSSGDGALVCHAPPAEGSGTSEADCEDVPGSTCQTIPEGSSGSPSPACEDGSEPRLASDGSTLVCEVSSPS